MFVPLKYTDCTLVLHYGSLHQMLTEQAAGCVLTSSPRSVDVKSYFQISCECIAFIADLLLCFGFPQPSVHTLYNTGYLLYMVIIMYQVYIHVRMKPQLVSIIHEIRSGRKRVTTSGLYTRIATCLPITTGVVCLPSNFVPEVNVVLLCNGPFRIRAA